jgi:hypothetical protein
MFQPQDDYNSLQTESGDVSLPLGNIEDLYARAKHCEVCALIVDSAERINEGVTIPPVCKNSPVECTLKQSYLGLMTNAIYRDRSNIDVRVNRLRIRFDPEPFGSHLFAPAVTLQGYIEPIPDHNTYETRAGMGRKFHSTIDISLLRSWLHLCETRHDQTWRENVSLQNGLRIQILLKT